MQETIIDYPSITFDTDVVRAYKTGQSFRIRISLKYKKIDAAKRMINIYGGGPRASPAWRAILDGPRVTDLLSPLAEAIEIGDYNIESTEDTEYMWINMYK